MRNQVVVGIANLYRIVQFGTDPEFVEEYSEQNKLVTKVKYYEMSDGTWRTDTHTYKDRLEITGRDVYKRQAIKN